VVKKIRLPVVPTHLIILCKLSQLSLFHLSKPNVLIYYCSNFDQMSSPLGTATMSRPRTAGMTRTQSGYILNLSMQPTPASSPRDGDYEQAGDYGVENTDTMAVDNSGEALPVSHSYILSFP
jgi:hypothetical protein